MAQTQHIKSARKTKDGTRPNCHTCHKPIEVGQAYYKNSPSRFSPTYSWHEGCPGPRPSTLESNEKRSTAYAACESAEDDIATIDGVMEVKDGGEPVEVDYDTRAKLVTDTLGDIFQVLADGLNEAVEMWRESASNIEDGFGHETEKSAEMNEHADVYEEAASDAENGLDQITEWAEPIDSDDLEAEFDEWVEQAKSEAYEVVNNVYGTLD